MTRLEKIKEYVEGKDYDCLESLDDAGVDAQEVADALGIYRTSASSALNTLWRQGILSKVGKKPVRFVPPHILKKLPIDAKGEKNETLRKHKGQSSNCATEEDVAFSGLIGSTASLKAQIQLAKAAVAYPPNGLHTMIFGETGVGKSYLAEAMWRYRVELERKRSGSRMGKEPPFVVFSCAEYSENPQLLMSQLFGYVKGAFTGANEDRPGLVERAQGGVLFLDEIHRLPPTGQEMLFMILDRGLFRRLGDTKDREARLLIIGATTENPVSTLLDTFRRRIPVLIQLPTLKERSVSERHALITHFISQEANRLDLPIQISRPVLQMFMAYECRANIGDLKNDLQLCCAKSYLSHLTGVTNSTEPYSNPVLTININDVPQKVYSVTQDSSQTGEPYVSEGITEGIIIYPGEMRTYETIINDYELSIDLYGFVQKRLDAYKHMSLSQEEVETKVGEDLERYFYATAEALHRQQFESVPPGIISPVVWSAANNVLDIASKKLQRKYNRQITVAFALHLQQFMERAKAGQIIYNPYLKRIKEEHTDEYNIAIELLPRLSQDLGVEVPEDEAGFLAMFLMKREDKKAMPRVGLIVAAHGRSTATSMVDVANYLLATNHIRAVDAPLDKSLKDMFNDLARTVTECEQEEGVLILADMGSFVEMEEDLVKKTGIKCRVLPNVSTILVLEAGKVVMTGEKTLDEMVTEIITAYRNYTDAFTIENLKGLESCGMGVRNAGTRGAVLTICPTGVGTAKKIREILLENLPIARTMDIIPVSALEDIKAITKKLRKNLRLIVGSINPRIEGVPFVEVNDILSGDGIKRIDMLLKGWYVLRNIPEFPDEEASRQETLNLMARQLDRFVSTLPAEVANKQCKFIIDKLEKEVYGRDLPVDLIVRIYLHTACMFDRLSLGEPLPMPEWAEGYLKTRSNEFEKLTVILNHASKVLNICVPPSEVCYFLVSLPENEES